MSASRRGPSRWSTLLHLAVAAVMVVVLVPLVLRAAQAAPPSIAEFAPQVEQTIHKAPPGQGSSLGSGDGAGGLATPTPSPTAAARGAAAAQASPTPLQVPPGARVNHCVGNPPRQIEDPQSPPCVPFYDTRKGNGGATSFGVTDKAITIAIPASTISGGAGDTPTLVNFFNDRFELYGRKLLLTQFSDSGVDATPESMQADATAVESQGAFAEMTYPAQVGGEQLFYDDLARQPHPVVSIQGSIASLSPADQGHLAAMAPYQWNYVQTPDIVERNLADVVCRQLVGHPPSHAGAPTNTLPTRKLGLLRGSRPGQPSYDDSLLVSAVQACTGSPLDVRDFDSQSNTAASSVAVAINDFATKGVTSVICVCFAGELDTDVMAAAAGQDFYPEWLVSDVIDQDGNEGLAQAPPAEASHALGIRSLNKDLPVLDTPYVWAVHYESPRNPKPPYSNYVNPRDDWVYHDLLLLASGIQMAGPNLTPQTFAAGLQAAQFPNPGCDGPPYYQACVGFDGGSHSMQQSFAEIWWDDTRPNDTTTTDNPGSFCYVAQGARHALGTWPTVDRIRQGSCT